MRQSGKLVDDAKRIVSASLKLRKGRMVDWQFARKQIEEELARFLKRETGRNPLIVPVLVEV